MPTDQAPLFHLPGPHGGWFASLLYGYPSVDVPMQELRELVAGSRGEVIVARRLTHEEAGAVETSRVHSDADAHAGIIAKEEKRFRRPRELVAGSCGEVIVARRLTHEEAGAVECSRVNSDADAHAGIISKEEKRFRRPRRKDKHFVEAGKLAVRAAVSTSGEIKDRVRRRRGA